MADIELVIKISEEDYKRGTVMASAIRNGKPLPKGHGDLVDRNDLKYEKYNSYAYAIANAPTIIPADKESET